MCVCACVCVCVCEKVLLIENSTTYDPLEELLLEQ